MTKGELKNKLAHLTYYVNGKYVDSKFKKLTIPIMEFNEAIEVIWKELEQKDKEIAELKEDNIRLRNAQEIGGNMYGHKLNEVSALHKQVESLTERVEAAEEVIAKVKPHLTVYASGYFLDNNTEVVEIIEKYNSLKSKTK